MKFKFKVRGAERNHLADAISGITGQPAVYQGTPTFAYTVGGFRIDKFGALTGDGTESLLAALAGQGFAYEQNDVTTALETPAPAAEASVDETSAPAAEASADETPTAPEEADELLAIEAAACIQELDELTAGEKETEMFSDNEYYSDALPPIREGALDDSIIEYGKIPVENALEAGDDAISVEEVMAEAGLLEAANTAEAGLLEATNTAEADLPEAESTSAIETLKAEGSRLTIEMPLDGFTEGTISNLEKMIASKAALIKKAVGAETLAVERTDVTLRFPWFSASAAPDEIDAYTRLVSALCAAAKEQKRVTAKEKPVDNERFGFRVFLIRLGFVGPEFKSARKILLGRLSGNSAFKNGAPPRARAAAEE